MDISKLSRNGYKNRKVHSDFIILYNYKFCLSQVHNISFTKINVVAMFEQNDI